MDDKDRALHRALLQILEEGSFHIKGKEVPGFLATYKWVQSLPDRLEEKIKDDSEHIGD